MKEIIAEITRLARRSPDVNQRSGVSVRASIANYESMLANSLRRAIVNGEEEAVPRVSDLPFVVPTLSGKVELETIEDGREEQIIEKLIQGAVVTVFNRLYNQNDLEPIVTRFKAGISVEVGEMTASDDYKGLLNTIEGLDEALGALEAGSPGEVAAGTEFILEGLHLNKRLNKDRVGAKNPVSGMSWRIERLPSGGPLFEGAIAVYAAAFAPPPYRDPDRGKELRYRLRDLHRERMGFRGLVALPGTSASAGCPRTAWWG